MKTLFLSFIACFASTALMAQSVNLHVTHDGQPVAYHTVTIKHGDMELGNGQTDADGRVSIQAHGLASRAIDVYGYFRNGNSEKKWSLKGIVKLDQSNTADIRMEEHIKDIASKSNGFMNADMLADSWGMPKSSNGDKHKRATNPNINNNPNNNNQNSDNNNSGRGGGTNPNNNNNINPNTNNGGSQNPTIDNTDPKDEIAKAKADMERMKADMERERQEMRNGFNNDKNGNHNNNNGNDKSSLEFVSENGEKFTVYLNKQAQNNTSSSAVTAQKTSTSGFIEVEIKFQNSSIASIKQNIAANSSVSKYVVKKMGSRYILQPKMF